MKTKGECLYKIARLRKSFFLDTFIGYGEALVSPKNCSLAYDVDVDFEDDITTCLTSTIEPNLRVRTNKRFVENSSVEEIIFVKGRINVSF